MIDQQQLANLRAKAEAATPGPWCIDDGIEVDYGHNGEPEQFQARPPAVTGIGIDPDSLENYSDAIFISAANPATVLAMIDEIERLREALGRIAKPTYGTELADTDEERAKHYWTLLQVMQHIARKALDAAKEQP